MGRQTSINIAARFKPFSHSPGACALIPYTDWFLTAYPTRLEISDFFSDTILIELDIAGPVKNFTLQQDLEKGVCQVFGTSKSGYFEFHVFVDQKEKSLALRYFRGDGIVVFVDGKRIKLLASEVLDLIDAPFDDEAFSNRERISLGSHKKQDVDLMWRRSSLTEILPLLYYSAQSALIPNLGKLRVQLSDENSFDDFVKTGFTSIFVPLRKDRLYQGLPCEELDQEATPLYRLKKFREAFRRLFIQETKKRVVLLPKLPPKFASGRFVSAKVSGAKIDFSWRKRKLRSVIIHGEKDGVIQIDWPKEVKTFRLDKKQKGMPRDSEIRLIKGKKTVVDKFTT